MADQTPKRAIRNRRLTDKEAADYDEVRQKFSKEELPGLRASGDLTTPILTRDYVTLVKVMARLKQARMDQGISLNELAERTGIDKGALSRLENGVLDNPTITTLSRYASAIGKEIIIGVIDLPPAAIGEAGPE
jgi:DNA-binding XRE family transcriptional regulator